MTTKKNATSSTTAPSKSGPKTGFKGLKKRTHLPDLNAIVEWKDEKWRVASYLFAFPNNHVVLDPVERIGKSETLSLKRIKELSPSNLEKED